MIVFGEATSWASEMPAPGLWNSEFFNVFVAVGSMLNVNGMSGGQVVITVIKDVGCRFPWKRMMKNTTTPELWSQPNPPEGPPGLTKTLEPVGMCR